MIDGYLVGRSEGRDIRRNSVKKLIGERIIEGMAEVVHD